MSETFHVRVAKERMVFSSAHFITYDGDRCEPLHGHNYRVAAEVEGRLDENHYVIDFILLRNALQELVDQLDHRVLLPTEHPAICVTTANGPYGQETTASHGERRWVFPKEDCVLLPIPNTTAEQLARYLASQMRTRLGEFSATRLRIEVDECDGQWGIYEWTRDPGTGDAAKEDAGA